MYCCNWLLNALAAIETHVILIILLNYIQYYTENVQHKQLGRPTFMATVKKGSTSSFWVFARMVFVQTLYKGSQVNCYEDVGTKYLADYILLHLVYF